MTDPPEPFGRLGALAARLGLTAEELADAVLLAASGYQGDAAAPGTPVDDTSSGTVVPRSPEQEPSPTTDPPRDQPAAGGHRISAYGAADGETQPGVRLTLGQAAALPQALAIGRALRPLRRRWRHGHRTELHVDATVEDYARTGLLVPHLVPMPERWLDVTVVLDRSSSMSVWDPAVDGLNRILRSLGALRTLNTWHLTWSGADPVLHDQRGALVPAGQAGRREGQPGRRLMLILSDCAAPGWRGETLWRHIHVWSRTTSLALFNPLPPRLWHRTALDLPLTVTTAPEPVAPSGSWLYEPKEPRRWRRESGIHSWRAVPVLGTDPEDLRRWAHTLMRGDPEGCTAVLIPDTGRPPRRAPSRLPARPAAPAPKPGARAEAFLRTARTPATQLAVHVAALDTFTLPILHALREQAVPEARLDDFAELLTAGLCTVLRNPEADDLYTFRPEALTRLRQELTRQTAWRTHQALTRHIASRPWTPEGLTAVLHTATGTSLPTALVPFAEAADSVLRQLGVTIPTAPDRVPTPASAPAPTQVTDPSTRPVPPEPASDVASALRERLQEARNVAPQEWVAKIRLLESLAADSEQLLGERHPDTLSARAFLAAAYLGAGRIGEAIAIATRVLADREAVLGKRHPDTLTARSQLAVSYYEAGRIDEAIAIETRVLADSEEVLGERHPDTIIARGNLAASYNRAGRIDEATAIRERVLADSVEVLGERHPDTFIARAHLATSYHQAGRSVEATAIRERVLADSVEVLGERHPDTIIARGNLASSYDRAGRVDEATAIRERVLADSVEVLGERHPDTFIARAHLATSYHQAGRVDEVTAIRERVLADSVEVLGERHPDTIIARGNLAASYLRAGRIDEARALEDRRPGGETATDFLPAPEAAEPPADRVAGPGPGTDTGSDDLGPAVPVTRTVRPPRRVSPYFFLSYAHTPGFGGGTRPTDMGVERFFRDLCGHVMAMTGLPADSPVGFMDREMYPGESWSERLSEMLAECRVFVPLYSPRYFTSEMCGREWHAFEQRTIHHRATRSNQTGESSIVPALWVPVARSQLPPAAAGLQFTHPSLGERYARDGLYGLIQLRRHAEEYERVVYEIAKRIVSVAETVKLTPGRPIDLDLVPSAFGSPSSQPQGMRPIQITVVAPTRGHLPEGRDPRYYGGSAQDWNPYHPASAVPLVHVTADLVRSLNHQTVTTSFDMESGRQGRRQPPDSPEILLMDRWALQDEDRRRRLAAHDAENPPWTAVIVPWNRDDGQSRAAEAELTEMLEQTMPVTMRRSRSFASGAAVGVFSMETFGMTLPEVVEAVVGQYRQYATAPPQA
ncbi:TIR-like protein FxsC [Streptomyces sp. NPDC002125]